MRAGLGVALVGLVVCVGCGPSKEEEAIAAIQKLGGILGTDENEDVRHLNQWHRHLITNVTDSGLVHLKRLTKLELLNLDGTKVTDAGLAHLSGLTRLLGLDLSNTKITDAGLVHLKELTKLEFLFLKGTKVTDAGVKKFRQALPVRTILR